LNSYEYGFSFIFYKFIHHFTEKNLHTINTLELKKFIDYKSSSVFYLFFHMIQ
jgi:hypothetical protein